MKLRLVLALAALTSLTAVASYAPVAHAQMSDGERKSAARAAYQEGVQLQDDKKFAEALVRFEAAQKLFDAPTHLLHIAECQASLGRLVEASETYELLIRKQLGANPPDAFTQAQDQGSKEAPVLRARIPTLRVTVKPEASQLQNLVVNVNDKQMPNELLGIARPVNPGVYKLTASANGYATREPVSVNVAEKTPATIELALAQVTGPTPIPPPYTSPAEQQPQPTQPTKDQATQPQPTTSGPTSTGLWIGARPGALVPGGNLEKNAKFEDAATAGFGLAIEGLFRVAKILFIGGTVELGYFGQPKRSSNSVAQGTTASFSATSTYLGLVGGIISSPNKVAFVGDFGLGYRAFSNTASLSGGSEVSVAYSGLDFTLGAGLAIPAGPIRIVPKAGLAFGRFGSRDCKLGAGAVSFDGCGSNLETDGHTIFNVGLGLYYALDFGKQPSGAASTRSPRATF